LRLCRNAADLTLPISKMRVIILDEIQHPMRSVPGLSEVWVRLRGLPAILLEPTRLLAATTMIAKPLHVDELSLVKEPSGVLMKFATPVPQRMRMSVVLYGTSACFVQVIDNILELPRVPCCLLRRSFTPCSSSSWPSVSIIQVYPLPPPILQIVLSLSADTTNSRVQSTWVCSSKFKEMGRVDRDSPTILLASKFFRLDRLVSSLGYVE
jgi:hypothetical protein